MDAFEAQYQQALLAVENSIIQAFGTVELPETYELATERIESNLDAWDYCYAIAIGMAGTFIATNEEFQDYLIQIHSAASGKTGDYDLFQSFLGNALFHKGDHIDLISKNFITRDGETKAYVAFHRLLWGHDILSTNGDNPFALMYEQKGMSGIIQAVRHLLADTMSKNGLPLPGSSFLDYTDASGKKSNYLIMIAQQLSTEALGDKGAARTIYEHMMTIRAQDVAAGTVVKLVSELYFKLRGIEDEIRKAEICLIGYAVNFFAEAAVGCYRQPASTAIGNFGVPYINVPLATVMATSFARFCYLNERDIYRLSKETDRLHAKVMELEESALTPEDILPEYSSAEELLKAADTAEDNMTKLLGFLGEGLT